MIRKIRYSETRLCWPPLELRQVANLQNPLVTMKIELYTNASENGQFRVVETGGRGGKQVHNLASEQGH